MIQGIIIAVVFVLIALIFIYLKKRAKRSFNDSVSNETKYGNEEIEELTREYGKTKEGDFIFKYEDIRDSNQHQRIKKGIQNNLNMSALHYNENVQFTVYRPNTVQPNKWCPLLCFAHLSEKPIDAQDDDPDPVEEVQRQAKQILVDQFDKYQDITQDSRHSIPREGEITFIPLIPGIEFNPLRRAFIWEETVHKEEFRMRASPELDGTTARGRVSVFLGSILLAEVSLGIRVDSKVFTKSQQISLETTSARPYRKIFASYSHKDAAIVEELEGYACP